VRVIDAGSTSGFWPGLRAVAVVVTVLALLSGCVEEGEPLAPTESSSPPAVSAPAPTPVPTPTPTFDSARFSIDDPTSLWVVSNKRRPLDPTSFVPPNLRGVSVASTREMLLRDDAAAATEAMFAAAQSEAGLTLQLTSAYRSVDTQTVVYNRTVGNIGQEGADQVSARPGHSEHQTGLAIDIGSLPASCTFDACFGDTAHGQWLAANAHRFGFIVRYPKDLTPITGFVFEPWHFRYVGLELAAELQATGIATLEEFFGLPAAPDYAG
jgi:D-alanyl-D-alanine carboxypeptidase